MYLYSLGMQLAQGQGPGGQRQTMQSLRFNVPLLRRYAACPRTRTRWPEADNAELATTHSGKRGCNGIKNVTKIPGLGSRQIFFRLRLQLLTFFKRLRLLLRLLVIFSSGSGSKEPKHPAPAPAPAPAPDYWLSLPKYSFPHKLVR